MVDTVLQDLNAQIKNMPRLTSFSLDISQYNRDDGCDDLLLNILGSLAELPSLQELSLGIVGNQACPVYYKQLFDRISKIKHLVRLEIPHMKLSRALILYLFSKISKLQNLESCTFKFVTPDDFQCKEDRRGLTKEDFLMKTAEYIGCLAKLASLEIRFPFVISNNLIKAFEERIYYKNKKVSQKMSCDVLAFLMNI